jgi:hypothetical protein
MRFNVLEQVVASLAAADMLPAIYFLFSRAGCDAAAALLDARGVTLTNAEEQSAILLEVEALRCTGPDLHWGILGIVGRSADPCLSSAHLARCTASDEASGKRKHALGMLKHAEPVCAAIRNQSLLSPVLKLLAKCCLASPVPG